MWSGTTLLLKSGAVLTGFEDCREYPVYAVPPGMELRTDQEMIPHYWECRHRPEYRRAMISAYGASDIAVIGEPGSVIDGADCYDPDGEEGFRGPHGIFFSNCRGITLRGYTIQNSGNFMHQLDCCVGLVMTHVTSLAGHDGIHLHCSSDLAIEDCVFRTGDDCIAGIDVNRLTVRRCELNTSCDVFRIGGTYIAVEDCRIWGPGYYPHRMTVVKGRGDVLPREAGRHNTLYLFEYFSSPVYPAAEPAHDWSVRNCTVEGVDRLLHFEAGKDATLHSGVPLVGIAVENTAVTGLAGSSVIMADPANPLEVALKNVTLSYRGGNPPRA